MPDNFPGPTAWRLSRRLAAGVGATALWLALPPRLVAAGALGDLVSLAEPTSSAEEAPPPAETVAGDISPSAEAVAGDVPPEISPLELITLALVNGSRVLADVAPLQWHKEMTEAARQHARDMAENGFISHRGSDGSTPQQRLRRAGVEFQFGSENIWTYWGKQPDQGPATMHAAMMAEPHRPGLWNHIGNILHAGYRRIGIGIVVAPSGVQYLAETFAD
jgi:uncharacterized protein YkwD